MAAKILIHRTEAQDFVQDITRLMATGAVLWGVAVLVGGRSTWAAPIYATALSLPGAPESWGTVAITTGGLLLVGSLIGDRARCWILLGGYGCGIWNIFFAMSFSKEAWNNPSTVGAGGAIQFLAAGIAFLLLTSLYRRANLE